MTSFGPDIPTVTLLLSDRGAFNESVQSKVAWADAPVIEFATDGSSWTSVVDANDATLAVFTEAKSTVLERTAGEGWLLRNVTTDEVIMQGQVQFQ